MDFDDRKRPKAVPQLAGWATPAGWGQELRPRSAPQQSAERNIAENAGNGQHNSNGVARTSDILREIELMERTVGKRMYRGLLKSLARVWNPKDIQDPRLKGKVLEHMQAAERGLRQAKAARTKVGLAVFATVLGSLKLSALDQVDDLKTLSEVVALLQAQPAKR